MSFAWIATYWDKLADGLVITLKLLLISGSIGTVLAVFVALALVNGSFVTRNLTQAFCTFIRGTPLLVQLFLLYYGIGALFTEVLYWDGQPLSRDPVFRPYYRMYDGEMAALIAFTLSTAAYTGVVIRGGLLAVPKGELEAARAFGMSRWGVLRRVWLPRALHLSLPALSGEAILLLKATPLASTVAAFDLYGAASAIGKATARTYEPLLLIALVYIALTLVMVVAFRRLENAFPGVKAAGSAARA